MAQKGHWDKAAADTGKAVKLAPSDDILWMTHATFLLRGGDIKGYRQACQEMLDRLGQTKQPIVAHRVACTCFLVPEAVSDPKLPMKLAELSAAGAPGAPWADLTMGFAHYRAGQFNQAIERLKPHTGRPEYEIVTSLFLAMAHRGLGQSDEARRWLDKAVQIMDKEMAAKEIGPHRRQYQSWAANQVLRGEAEELLKK